VINSLGPHLVRVNTTKNFDENNEFLEIINAEVAITNDAGNTEMPSCTEDGIYETTALFGVPCRTYYLRVKTEGETFTATSTMPAPMSIDDITHKVWYEYRSRFTTDIYLLFISHHPFSALV
jgi:hypothetical protein